MKFWIFTIFMKHFLKSWYEYANKWVDDFTVSQFSINLVHKNDENPIFQLWESKTCHISKPNKCKIMIALINFDMETCIYMFEQRKEKSFKLLYYTKYVEKSEAMTTLYSSNTQLVEAVKAWVTQSRNPVNRKSKQFRT